MRHYFEQNRASGALAIFGLACLLAAVAVVAEGAGGGDGRVYHIGFTAEDGMGGMCTGEVLVSVPLRKGIPAGDGGALYDSTVTP